MGAQKKAIDATVLGYVGQWLGMTENNLSQVTSKIHKSVFTIIVDSTLKLRLQWEFTCMLDGWVHVHINLSKGMNVIKTFFWIKTKSGTQITNSNLLWHLFYLCTFFQGYYDCVMFSKLWALWLLNGCVSMAIQWLPLAPILLLRQTVQYYLLYEQFLIACLLIVRHLGFFQD